MAVIALRESEDIEWVEEDLLDITEIPVPTDNQHAPIMKVVTSMVEHLSSPWDGSCWTLDKPPNAKTIELAGVAHLRVKEVLDLGVNFNSKLNFSNYISIITAKVNQRLFLLKKSFRSRNPSLLILSFKTYVIPLLEYCSQVWNPQNE